MIMMVNIFQGFLKTVYYWATLFICFIILRYLINYKKINLFKHTYFKNYIFEIGAFLLVSISSGLMIYLLYIQYLEKIADSKLFTYFSLLSFSSIGFIGSFLLLIKTTNIIKLLKKDLSIFEKILILLFVFFMSISFTTTVGLWSMEIISQVLFKLPFSLSHFRFDTLLSEVTCFIVSFSMLLFIDGSIAEERKSLVEAILNFKKKERIIKS